MVAQAPGEGQDRVRARAGTAADPRCSTRSSVASRETAGSHAAIAAWQYARKANTALHDETMRAFSGIAKGHQRTEAMEPLQSPEAIMAARPTAKSPFLDHARLAFTYETRSAK